MEGEKVQEIIAEMWADQYTRSGLLALAFLVVWVFALRMGGK